jgi:hypothetical protein
VVTPLRGRKPISTTLGRWAVASVLATVAFGAAFGVASNVGTDDPAPVSVRPVPAPTTSPTTNNLERVSSMKPLRAIAGSPPPKRTAQP